MNNRSNHHETEPQDRTDQDRRDFLVRCGRFAAVTPPALTFLLSTSLKSSAIAQSSGGPKGPKGPKDPKGPKGHKSL